MKLKEFLMSIIFKEYSSPDKYLDFLRNAGATIGKGTKIFASARNVFIDPTRPWLINIGENVQITRNVTILTHGYDWSVIKGKYGDVIGSSGKVMIGNNVFIGMNSTILKGTTIGNNVIIGANSLVSGIIPDNSVVVGNPCKVICDIDSYFSKRKDKQLEEAKELVVEYYKKFSKIPNKSLLREFFWLFSDRKEELIEPYQQVMKLVGNEDISINRYNVTKPIFDTYEKFIEFCINE